MRTTRTEDLSLLRATATQARTRTEDEGLPSLGRTVRLANDSKKPDRSALNIHRPGQRLLDGSATHAGPGFLDHKLLTWTCRCPNNPNPLGYELILYSP